MRSGHGLVMVVVVAVTGMVGSSAAWATWTDPVPVSGTSLGAMVVPSPDTITCSGNLATTVTIGTTPVADTRVQYVARLFTAATGGTEVGTEQVMIADGSQRVATYSIDDFPGIGLGTTYYARVFARLRDSPTWLASGHHTFSFSATSLFLATVFSCGSQQN